jgi:hypothetical protein
MTLAYYGKSRGRQSLLALGALLALLVAMIGGVMLYQRATAAAPDLPSSVQLYQWETAGSGSPDWITGNLGTNNSDYHEGQTVPFRLDLTGVPAGAYVFSICRDYRESGGAFGYVSLSPFTTSRAATHGTITSTSGPFSAENATITSEVETNGPGGCGATAFETVIQLTITGTPTSAFLYWGGRLAAPGDPTPVPAGTVPSGESASFWSGASLHMALLSPAKDRSIQTNAVIPVGATITVHKTESGGLETHSGDTWNYHLSGGPTTKTDRTIAESGVTIFSGLAAGTYTVNETNGSTQSCPGATAGFETFVGLTASPTTHGTSQGSVVVVAGQNTDVYYINNKCTQSLPTVVKTVSTGTDATKAYWNIAIDNTGTNSVPRTGIAITDTGATLESTSPSDANNGCTGTVTTFTCKVGAGTTLNIKVSKPLSGATFPNGTCQPGSIDNSITSATIGTASLTFTNPASPIVVPGTAAASCLNVKKEPSVGGYVITIGNTGPQTTVNVQDTFDAHGTGETLGAATYAPTSPGQTCTTALFVGSGGCNVTVPTGGLVITIAIDKAGSNSTCAAIDTDNTVAARFLASTGDTIGTAIGGSVVAHHTIAAGGVECDNGNIVVKKVRDPNGAAADSTPFGGKIDGSTGWGTILIGGSTSPISVPADDHVVTETTLSNGWTTVGFALADTNHDCPTAASSYTGNAASLTATVTTENTTYVCVMNTAEVTPPTVVKTVDGTGLAGDGRVHWIIEINNNHTHAADQTVVVTDIGARLDSVSPIGDAADCGATPIATGPFSCSVLKTHDIFLHVSKPIPTMTTLQQCQGFDVPNIASATYGAAAPITITVDNSQTTIHVPADTTQCPGPQLSKTAVGFSGGTATWTITIANTGAGAIPRTVVITDLTATLVGSTPAVCSGTLAAGLSCNLAAAGTLSFNVQATGLAQACQPPSVTNSASATIDSVNIGGSPTGAVSITIPANTALCPPVIILCQVGCNPPVPTPTPTVIPPTATPTRPVVVPPTSTPTTTDVVLGAKTPGPTPIAPSTGSGLFGTSSGSTNVLLALFGLFALSSGLATLAFGRRKTRS